MIVGYARVSTTDQDLTVQIQQLEAAGCERIFSEKATGTSIDARLQLQEAMRFVREGDTLVVTRIDRIARSMADFSNIITQLRRDKVNFRCSEQPITTEGPVGELMLNVLAAFAQFETQLRRERQIEGIRKARARNVYKGRPPSIDKERVINAWRAGAGPAEIARTLNCSEPSVYRIIAAYKADAFKEGSKKDAASA